MSRYEVLLRNANNTLAGYITEFQNIALIKRHNAAGKWTLRGEGTRPIAPGQGIVVRKDGAPIFSGLMRGFSNKNENKAGQYVRGWEVTGIDDLGKLGERTLLPDPITGNFNVLSNDIRTGAAETVILEYARYNFGQLALPHRRIPNFTVAESLGRGSEVPGNARFNIALEYFIELAQLGGSLGFRISYDTNQNQVFEVYQPRDMSNSVMFSLELGTLSSFTHNGTAPSANTNFYLGQGVGVDRQIESSKDDASILEWGLIEAVKDRRDVSDPDDLKALSNSSLQSTAAKSGFAIAPIENDFCGFRYGVDYDMGDIVSVADDGEVRKEIIREIKLEIDQNGNEKFTPGIGEAATENNGISNILAKMKATDSRLTNLEVSE